MPECMCGCGGETSGKWCPGHDQKYRIKFEKEIGGLDNYVLLGQIIQNIGSENFFSIKPKTTKSNEIYMRIGEDQKLRTEAEKKFGGIEQIPKIKSILLQLGLERLKDEVLENSG